jgi:SNF2 family DNA or RNA helicase
MSKKKRDEVVESFQNDSRYKIFILSLKAGGVGLNLTAANHVVHYDLWFNPAVENQATDRAFRIGQTKKVTVHRLITKNSFEEKIDKMIKSKQELSDLSVNIGENWLKDMDRDDLKELFN